MIDFNKRYPTYRTMKVIYCRYLGKIYFLDILKREKELESLRKKIEELSKELSDINDLQKRLDDIINKP